MGDHDPDEVQIRGLELLAFCGVLDEEQTRRQPFRLDIDLHTDLRAAGRSDDLHDTVDYGAVADRVVDVVGAERYQLVEREMGHRAGNKHPLRLANDGPGACRRWRR